MPEGMLGEINAKQTGAQGNGITDDTAALQAMLSDLIQNNGGSIYLPAGIYPISSTLNMAGINNAMFRGAGLTDTQIVRLPGFAGATFSGFSGVVRCRDMTLPDFAVQGLNTPPSIPATTVAITNPFPFDCEVHIIAGTITVITVGGSTTGLSSNASGVTVQVKAGQTIAMTYSVAPTSWTWFGIGG